MGGTQEHVLDTFTGWAAEFSLGTGCGGVIWEDGLRIGFFNVTGTGGLTAGVVDGTENGSDRAGDGSGAVGHGGSTNVAVRTEETRGTELGDTLFGGQDLGRGDLWTLVGSGTAASVSQTVELVKRTGWLGWAVGG